jgi:hypothetical protein
MSDKEDVKNALSRRTDLNIREVTSIKEVFAEGGGVYKHKYIVQWLEDDSLNSEGYFADEYEEAKELYYQIKYDLGDSQYKKFGINIMDIETGEIVFGDEFEYAQGGEIDEVISINIQGYPYYLKKMGDTTHFKMANSKDGIDMVIGSHIAQHKGEEYYSDVASWLKGGKSPNGKSYSSYYYAEGGGISGLDDLIRG